MKVYPFLYVVTLLCLFSSCSERQVENCGGKSVNSNLKHLVFLRLNDSLRSETRDSLVKRLEVLSDIPNVKKLSIVTSLESKNPRALDHDVLLIMTFDHMKALEAYQNDSLHLAIKAGIKPYLAGPPRTFDYTD